MTKLVFGLVQVHHNRPGETKPSVEAPRSVYPVSDEDYKFLRSKQAVRDPTEQELLAFRFANGELVAAKTPAEAAPPPPPPPPPTSDNKKPTGKASPDADDSIG